MEELVRLYVGNMDDGHAEIKMNVVHAHIDNTWLVRGLVAPKTTTSSTTGIRSRVILIEFDDQRPPI